MIRIAFEAKDGAGKTTCLKYCLEQLKERGYSALETREVGNPNIPACVKLREFVLDPNSKLSGESMELLFSAMRIENEKWYKTLENSGQAPQFLLSDREYLSHVAYTDHNVSVEFSNKLYNDFLFNITSFPDVVIYFRVSTETALKRRVKRGGAMDVIEMKGVEYQEKVGESFEKYIDETISDKVDFYFVDANQDLDNVKFQLNNILDVIIDKYITV